jgi:hypothetical protein
MLQWEPRSELGEWGRSENDVVVDDAKIDGQRHGAPGFGEYNPAHATGTDQFSAALEVEGGENGLS